MLLKARTLYTDQEQYEDAVKAGTMGTRAS